MALNPGVPHTVLTRQATQSTLSGIALRRGSWGHRLLGPLLSNSETQAQEAAAGGVPGYAVALIPPGLWSPQHDRSVGTGAVLDQVLEKTWYRRAWGREGCDPSTPPGSLLESCLAGRHEMKPVLTTWRTMDRIMVLSACLWEAGPDLAPLLAPLKLTLTIHAFTLSFLSATESQVASVPRASSPKGTGGILGKVRLQEGTPCTHPRL